MKITTADMSIEVSGAVEEEVTRLLGNHFVNGSAPRKNYPLHSPVVWAKN